jgi:hypothetical protein
MVGGDRRVAHAGRLTAPDQPGSKVGGVDRQQCRMGRPDRHEVELQSIGDEDHVGADRGGAQRDAVRQGEADKHEASSKNCECIGHRNDLSVGGSTPE